MERPLRHKVLFICLLASLSNCLCADNRSGESEFPHSPRPLLRVQGNYFTARRRIKKHWLWRQRCRSKRLHEVKPRIHYIAKVIVFWFFHSLCDGDDHGGDRGLRSKRLLARSYRANLSRCRRGEDYWTVRSLYTQSNHVCILSFTLEPSEQKVCAGNGFARSENTNLSGVIEKKITEPFFPPSYYAPPCILKNMWALHFLCVSHVEGRVNISPVPAFSSDSVQ